MEGKGGGGRGDVVHFNKIIYVTEFTLEGEKN